MSEDHVLDVQEIHPIAEIPKITDPTGDGWSVDIVLIFAKKRLRGYYDPKGCISGGKFFYYRGNGVKNCATLKKFPTHWQYA